MTVAAGTVLWRSVRVGTVAATWSPRKFRDPPVHRFDGPGAVYRTLYLAADPAGAFAESFLRTPPVRVIERTTLAERRLARFTAAAPLTLVAAYGPGLAKLGATAALTSIVPYDVPQAWARACWSHPSEPAGLAYASRFDNALRCYALFDRAKTAVTFEDAIDWLDPASPLATILERYQLPLIG